MSVKEFVDDWYDGGGESGNYQKFWWTLLRDVFGVDKPERLIEFQKPVGGWHIDAYIAETKVLIEHKSFGVDLSKKYPQSDGKLLTPYEQAKRYADALPAKDKPRWIVTCNFAEFHIYDRTKNLFDAATTIIKLRDLRYQFERLKFLIDPAADTTPPAEKISKDALDVITKIYDTFAKNYQRNQVADFEDALNKICTRLVFCLYADDAKLFGDDKFFGYLQSFPHTERNFALQRIFDVLNTPDDRRQNFDAALKKFPYVNGGLFDEKISLPEFNSRVDNPAESIGALNARKKFSWHEIDPPVFGAMFESTFSRAKRQRASGMFYTSTDNIHKVIDPLFLDDLRDEFADIKRMHKRNRPQALFALQNKLAALKFLDPACGSGNFLTETYLSLRRLENEILEELRPLVDLPANPVKVSINQFYGIEIDSFAVAVAKVALWIAENQMLQQTEDAIATNLQALPLKNYATVVRANALRIDWATVAPNVTYIIGNPPYRGYSDQTSEQKADMRIVWADNPKAGKLDYVSAWYRKAVEFIRGTKIRCAFLSTNSIVQGEQCADVWKILYERFGVHIDFAHRTFKWLSDSENMAHVHCVVVGFSRAANVKPKKIFVDGVARPAKNINFYLIDDEIFFVKARTNPLQDGVPKMTTGNRPADGGKLIIKADDLDYFLQHEPNAAQYIRPLLGADEFIDGKRRYCLWLVGVPLDVIKTMPLVAERVEACRQDRLKNGAADRKKLAATPHLFRETKNPKHCLVIPEISSEQRQYIPMSFLSDSVICTNRLKLVPTATLYHFGVLTSSIHMAWVRTVCGRLEMRYDYSIKVVYNNFPWATVTAERRLMIERSAQNILDVRSKFPTWTFAALYNEDTMPDALRDAHKMNDMAVALAYGYENFFTDEARVVAELMKFYRRLTDG